MDRLPSGSVPFHKLPEDEWAKLFIAAWNTSTTHEEVAAKMRMMVCDVPLMANHYGLTRPSLN